MHVTLQSWEEWMSLLLNIVDFCGKNKLIMVFPLMSTSIVPWLCLSELDKYVGYNAIHASVSWLGWYPNTGDAATYQKEAKFPNNCGKHSNHYAHFTPSTHLSSTYNIRLHLCISMIRWSLITVTMKATPMMLTWMHAMLRTNKKDSTIKSVWAI